MRQPQFKSMNLKEQRDRATRKFCKPEVGDYWIVQCKRESKGKTKQVDIMCVSPGTGAIYSSTVTLPIETHLEAVT